MKGPKDANDFDERLEIPELLTRTLDFLESDSLLVLPGEELLHQSEGLVNSGVIRDGRIASEDLIALIRGVRRSNSSRRGSIEIARGPIGQGKRELNVSATPLTDDGLILVLISDESESRRIDAVRRDFVANVSHELKTPIGALGLLSEAILGAKNQPEEVVRFATKMQSEAKRLADLVQEIIDLSRLQSSDPLKKALPLEISEVIRVAVGQAQLNAEARGIEVKVGIIKDVTVIGDYEQLITAVHNLIENAINYSPEHTKVSVTSNIVDDLVEIAVSDQGIGIPKSELTRIFERFYRVDPARSRLTGGTGLGLSIVKHVALNHGGDVKVWSQEGVGSTFSILLPMASNQEIGEGA
jgi:two-component system sensor histidine kinase SenX3